MWSSLWPGRPNDEVHFDLAAIGSETSLKFTLLTPDDPPETRGERPGAELGGAGRVGRLDCRPGGVNRDRLVAGGDGGMPAGGDLSVDVIAVRGCAHRGDREVSQPWCVARAASATVQSKLMQ